MHKGLLRKTMGIAREHVYRCKGRQSSQGLMQCGKCNQPRTNTHLLGGCKHSSKLRTSRHNSTFKLLNDLLKSHNGGRWPIDSMDLRKNPIKDFKTHTQKELKLATSRPYSTSPRGHARRTTAKRQNNNATPHNNCKLVY